MRSFDGASTNYSLTCHQEEATVGAVLKRKFENWEQIGRTFDRVQKTGRKGYFLFNFDAIDKVHNTTNPRRLVLWT